MLGEKFSKEVVSAIESIDFFEYSQRFLDFNPALISISMVRVAVVI